MAFNNTLNLSFGVEYLNKLPELVSNNLGVNLLNIVLYSIGMVIYAVIIWNFYRFLARRDIFKGEFDKPEEGFFLKIWDFIIFIYQSLILFPVFTFIWFLILGAFLLFLSKSQNVSHILLMSMTVIASARMTAYYNEDLSKDVAKMVPFTLLGVFIVDPRFFSIDATIEKFMSIPSNIHLILQYLIFIVLLEFTLKIIHSIKNSVVKKD